MVECPVWRLKSAHYLSVPGNVWEQTEVSRETGKQARKQFPVPVLLNPNDAADCDRNGEVLVYHEVEGAKGPRFGHIFIGEPTPEMEPMNDAAEEISRALEAKWAKPFTEFKTSEGEDFNARLLQGLENAFTRAMQSAGGIPQAQAIPDQRDEMIAKLQEQIAELSAKLGAQPETARRV